MYGERIDELLLQVSVLPNPDEEYYAHTDRLGSVMVMVQPDGDIAESYRYTEFGQPTIVDSSFTKLSTPESQIGNSVWYTGRTFASAASRNGETWYDYRARHYRAGMGRFVQRDPLAYTDGSNSYYYVRGNPIMLTDPLGLEAGSCCNNTSDPIWIIPEPAGWPVTPVQLEPGQCGDCECIYSPDGSKCLKVGDDCTGTHKGNQIIVRCDTFFGELNQAIYGGWVDLAESPNGWPSMNPFVFSMY